MAGQEHTPGALCSTGRLAANLTRDGSPEAAHPVDICPEPFTRASNVIRVAWCPITVACAMDLKNNVSSCAALVEVAGASPPRSEWTLSM